MLRQIVGLKVIPLPLAVAGKSKVRLNVRPFSADSPDSGPLRPRCSTPHSETTTTARKRVFRLTVETTSENILATRIVCALHAQVVWPYPKLQSLPNSLSQDDRTPSLPCQRRCAVSSKSQV